MDTQLFWMALAKKGIPAIALARRIGVHHSTMSMWARGHYSVPDKYKSKIAEELEVEESQLFNDSASANSNQIKKE